MKSQRDTKGRFEKGMIPWNKGVYGYMGSNKTSFTKEDIEKRRKIGVPRKSKDGLICCSEEKIKTKSKNGKIYMHQRRVSYARWIIEKQENRKLNKNEVVYHLDGDTYNNDISNLKIITRAELAKINRKKGK